MKNIHKIGGEIYITNNEEIKEGDYWIYICPRTGLDNGDDGNPIVKNNLPNSWFKKLHDKNNYKNIILTTDQDLIKGGVQAIDDEFLEWFVKNQSCEKVEVEPLFSNNGRALFSYKIIIPKQETLKEAIVKWQQERMYSEEDMKEAFLNGEASGIYQYEYGKKGSMDFKYFIENFKKKEK